MAYCTKVIPEGEQKAHNYTCFARSALYTGNFDLYALVKDKEKDIESDLVIELHS